MIGDIAPDRVDLVIRQTASHRKFEADDPDLLPLIAIDPGGTTGWSLIVLQRTNEWWRQPLREVLATNMFWFHGQVDCQPIDPGAKALCKLLTDNPSAAVMSESFFVRQMAADLSPVRLMAIMEHHLWHQGRVLHQQQAATGKRVNDSQLQELGAYTSEGGLQHARDADRHAIMTIRRCMDKNGPVMRNKLWPNVYGRR